MIWVVARAWNNAFCVGESPYERVVTRVEDDLTKRILFVYISYKSRQSSEPT